MARPGGVFDVTMDGCAEAVELLLLPPGSDGTYNFWDKDSKQRLKAMAKATYGAEPAPIPCSTFNSDGSIYAYAISYDWSRGFQNYNPQQMPNYIHLHGIQEQEVRTVVLNIEWD